MFEVDLKFIIRLLINVFIKWINDQIFNTTFDELKEVKFSERNKMFEESQRSKIFYRKKKDLKSLHAKAEVWSFSVKIVKGLITSL